MTVLESTALAGIGGGGYSHINLAPGERMNVPKGCVGVQREPGKCTIIRPASGAKLESQRVVQDERNLIVCALALTYCSINTEFDTVSGSIYGLARRAARPDVCR
jgi:hypothetical protein